MIRIKSDKIIVGESLFDGYIYIDGDKIAGLSAEPLDADTCLDYTGNYVSPGFIDAHTHGAAGCSFMFGSAQDVAKACDTHMQNGTTTILPTISACDIATMDKALENIAKAKSLTKANLLGAHLEGPYFAPTQAGAQSTDFITEPKKEDYQALVKKHGAHIARWSYAPERDADGEFCKFVAAHGIMPSAGHTDATYADIAVAIESGCRLITHLYSATSTVRREFGFRKLGVIESCFLRDELTAELIADGKHLPPELIQMIVKIKGSDNVIVCTDSLEITATDVKQGVSGHTEFIVEDGVCKLKDRSAFAGSIATANRLIAVLTKECGFDVPTAVKMMTTNVARLFGLNKGVLKAGADADVVVFDQDVNLKAVFVMGKKEA